MTQVLDILKKIFSKDNIAMIRHLKGFNDQNSSLKQPYMGDVVVLVNGNSFSVTSEFATVAKASGRVRMAGEETGGAYGGNNSGTFIIVTLPNSRLSVGIPMVGYYMAVPPIQPLDRGVLPDVEIKPGIEQIIIGEDLF